MSLGSSSIQAQSQTGSCHGVRTQLFPLEHGMRIYCATHNIKPHHCMAWLLESMRESRMHGQYGAPRWPARQPVKRSTRGSGPNLRGASIQNLK